MKLNKAIEILNDLLGEGPQFSPDDRREAVKLGVEALQFVKRLRIHDDDFTIIRLPGETSEIEP